MKALCKKHGLLFHCSDAHFKEESHCGSCCGMPCRGDFKNFSKTQFTQAAVIAREKGFVKWEDIQENAEWLKKIKWINAPGYNTGNKKRRAKYRNLTMFEYMRNIWNNPKNANSPYKYFGGVLVPKNKDKNGNLIYYYEDSNPNFG